LITPFGTCEFAIIGFCCCLLVVGSVCQTLSDRLSLIHMECNQSCRCHSHHFLPKKKKPPVGDFSLILSYDLINAPRLSPIFSTFITAQTSKNTAAIVAIPRTTRISRDCHKAFTMQ